MSLPGKGAKHKRQIGELGRILHNNEGNSNPSPAACGVRSIVAIAVDQPAADVPAVDRGRGEHLRRVDARGDVASGGHPAAAGVRLQSQLQGGDAGAHRQLQGVQEHRQGVGGRRADRGRRRGQPAGPR